MVAYLIYIFHVIICLAYQIEFLKFTEADVALFNATTRGFQRRIVPLVINESPEYAIPSYQH